MLAPLEEAVLSLSSVNHAGIVAGIHPSRVRWGVPVLLGLLLLAACDEDDVAPAEAPDTTAEAETAAPAAVEQAGAVEPDPEAPSPSEDTALVPADVAKPIDERAKAVLGALVSEEIPTPDEFYYRSNEMRHDLLVPHLDGLGGAVVGVGSDQLYTLAAMASASLIVGADYDARIPETHQLYQVLVPKAETVDALIAFFAPENEDGTAAILEAANPGDVGARQASLFRRIRVDLYEYLEKVKRRERDGVPGSWLAKPEWYAYVRSLFQNDRVWAVTADVTGDQAFRAVGRALSELHVPVRVLYYSNAEQFFRYNDDFVTNVKALPVDERTLVVRTIRHRRIDNAEDGRWHYMVQDFSDFLERLESGAYPRSYLLVDDLVHAGSPHVGDGISVMTKDTPRHALARTREGRN